MYSIYYGNNPRWIKITARKLKAKIAEKKRTTKASPIQKKLLKSKSKSN